MIKKGAGKYVGKKVTVSDVKLIYQELTELKHTGKMFKTLFAGEENDQKEKVIIYVLMHPKCEHM